MAGAPESNAVTSVDLQDAIRLIEEVGDDPATPDPATADATPDTAPQDRAPDPAAPEASQGQPSQDGAAQQAPKDPAAEAAPAGEEAEAPEFWDEHDKAAWAKVPSELRPVLRKYEQQRLDHVAEKTRAAAEERDEAMRVAQGANALVEQAADWWRKNGTGFHRAFVDRWAKVDWKGLAEKDPAEVGRLMQQRQEEEALLAEATRRGEADIAAAEQRAEEELAEARRVENAKLAARLPEFFGTPQVAERTHDELRRFLFGKGIPADRIASVYEAPIVELALSALRFEQAKALAARHRLLRDQGGEGGRTPAARPTAPATPTRVAPGPASPPANTEAEAARRIGERFRQSGGTSIADAAELIRLSGL